MIKKLFKKYEEIISYVVVGGLTTFVSLFSYYLCTFTFLNPNKSIELQVANIISWICAVTFAYFTNRKYVFKSNNSKLKESIKFYLSRVSTLLIDMFCMYLFVSVFNINDKISKLLVQVIVFILNYVFSKLIVFKKNK